MPIFCCTKRDSKRSVRRQANLNSPVDCLKDRGRVGKRTAQPSEIVLRSKKFLPFCFGGRSNTMQF